MGPQQPTSSGIADNGRNAIRERDTDSRCNLGKGKSHYETQEDGNASEEK
jgi:hypothetical protein